MKNIRIFLSENVHFLLVKFSVYLNGYVFVTIFTLSIWTDRPEQTLHVDPDQAAHTGSTLLDVLQRSCEEYYIIMELFSQIRHEKVWYEYSLEAPHYAFLMSTHNI